VKAIPIVRGRRQTNSALRRSWKALAQLTSEGQKPDPCLPSRMNLIGSRNPFAVTVAQE